MIFPREELFGEINKKVNMIVKDRSVTDLSFFEIFKKNSCNLKIDMLLYSSMIFTESLRLFFARFSMILVEIGNKKRLVFLIVLLQNPVAETRRKTQDVKGGFLR